MSLCLAILPTCWKKPTTKIGGGRTYEYPKPNVFHEENREEYTDVAYKQISSNKKKR
jgi:hypothetical protein